MLSRAIKQSDLTTPKAPDLPYFHAIDSWMMGCECIYNYKNELIFFDARQYYSINDIISYHYT